MAVLYYSQTVTADTTIFCSHYTACFQNIVYDDCLVRACVVQCSLGTVNLKKWITSFLNSDPQIKFFSVFAECIL